MYAYDSRQILPGDTFICLPGGEAFIEDAYRRGAVDVLEMSRPEFADFSDLLFGQPSRDLCVIGITGTNGKTTVASLVHHVLTQCGYNCLCIGTLTHSLTTPESYDLQQMMYDHLNAGGTHVVMEVSSHGIAQSRVAGIQFDVKCLTNLAQDHLDFHKTIQNYHDTKLRFLKEGPGFSIYPDQFDMLILPFENPLKGEFNALNMKAALAILRALLIDEAQIFSALASAKAPPGRFELIDEGQPFTVIIDFAHTPDGLEVILKEGAEIARKQQGHLIVVFGCGGDRDRTKRPKMGRVASVWSDYVVLTQDNPRSELQGQIIQDILEGFSLGFDRFVVQNDREKAIAYALSMAQPNDVVVIAGKGHETTQVLSSGPIPFDDRVCSRAFLKQRYAHES